MIQTTIHDLLNESIDTTGHRLYLVKLDDDNVLYVGQTTNFTRRLRDHISDRVHSYGSLLGKAIHENKPDSENWKVDLYTIDECSGLVKKWFPRISITSEEIVRYAEDALIHNFNPLYNRVANTGPRDNSPFLERKKREKKEEYRQREIQKAQKREYLVNSVCDVCGEHDTWVNVDDMLPCGVLEDHHGFKLLCNSCDEVLSLMKVLKQKSDRVQKVKKALEMRPEDSSSMYLDL